MAGKRECVLFTFCFAIAFFAPFFPINLKGLPIVFGKLNGLNLFSRLTNDWQFSTPEGSSPPNTRSSNTWES